MTEWLAEHADDVRLVVEIVGAVAVLVGGKFLLAYRAISKVLVDGIEAAAEKHAPVEKKRLGEKLRAGAVELLTNLAADRDVKAEKKRTKRQKWAGVGKFLLKVL